METVQIDGSSNYCRDIKTHAVININNTEYESYMRQKKIIEETKSIAMNQTKTIESMTKDIELLKTAMMQLLNRDSNGSTSS